MGRGGGRGRNEGQGERREQGGAGTSGQAPNGAGADAPGAGADEPSQAGEGSELDQGSLEPSFGSQRLFENRFAHLLAWYLLPALLVLVVGALIATSAVRLHTSLYLFGQQTAAGRAVLRPGQPNAIRLALFDKISGKFLPHFRARVTFAGPLGRRVLFKGSGPEALEVNFRLPKELRGEGRLLVRACGRGGCRKTSLPVLLSRKAASLLPTGLDGHDTLPDWSPPVPDPEGTLVEVSPQGGWSLPGELPAGLCIRFTDSMGRPRRMEARVRFLAGLLQRPVRPGELLWDWRDTGDAGLACFRVRTRRRLLVLQIEYRRSESSPIRGWRYELVSRPAPAVLRGSGRIVRPGSLFVLEAESLSGTGPLYLDAYGQGGLRSMHRSLLRASRARFRLKAPDQEGLWFLEVYSDLVAPGQSVATWVSYVTRKPHSSQEASQILGRIARVLDQWARSVRSYLHVPVATQALRQATAWEAARMQVLAEWAASAPASEAQRAVAYALGRLQGFAFQPAVLVETFPREHAALLAAKHRSQTRLLALLGVGVALFLGLVVLVVLRQVQAARRAQQEIARVASEDLGLEERELWRTDLGARRESKVLFWIQTGAVVFVILFAIASVVVLVTNLVWGMQFR